MKRFLKLAFAAILAVGTIATVFAFTAKEEAPAKKLAPISFIYTGLRPATEARVLDAANWTQGTPSATTAPRDEIYAITFDTDTYPLVNSKPDFSGQDDLAEAVGDNYATPSLHGSTVNSVTLFYIAVP